MKKGIIFLFSIIIAALWSCETTTYDDLIEEEEVVMEPGIVTNYVENIKPIVDSRCVVCHTPGGAASFAPLTNYQQVSSRISAILDRIQRPSSDPMAMPPGGPQLPQNTINLFLSWQEDGLPENP